MATHAGKICGVTEAAARLRSPFAHEEFSPLLGETPLIVDLAQAAPGLSGAETSAFASALSELPCPTIGWTDRAGAAAAPLSEHFDLLLDDDSDLETVLGWVERRPLASMAAAQLLRHSQDADLHEALIAESLVYSTLQSGPEFAAWLAGRGAPRTRPSNPEPAVLVERDGDRLALTFNRPEKRNAFSAQMRDALAEGLRIAQADESLQVVLRGAGDAFCSGGDLDEFGTLPDPATAHAIRSTRNAGRILSSIAPRVRVELHGACVGAGIELPAFAGRVAARPDAFFQLPEVSLGLVPGAGGTASLPRRIGRQRTLYMALTGHRIDAPTALAWGLVDELSD